MDFFKSLFVKVKNWNSFKPSMEYYFNAINSGKYSNRELPVKALSQAKARQEEYSKEMQDILDEAPRDSKGNLLAPNDKKSNLTERQYAQVRTKAFKDWFGDWENDQNNASKVVDENGEPLVVYHYTDNEGLTKFSTEFDNYFSKAGGTKKAIFFTTDNVVPGSEDNFLTSRKAKLLLFLNIKNLETFNGTKDDLHKQGTSYREVVNKSSEREGSENGIVFTGFDDNRKENQTIYIVHNSNQIKSATDNIGTFSRTDNDIRYRKVPNSSFESLDTEIQENLLKKGWTAEKFDSISQEERDQAVKCIAF